MDQRPQLPNATAVLVLGILSIVCSCFFVGLVLGIIGLVLAKQPRRMYAADPSAYDGYGSLNAGFIMSIIGTALGGLYVLYAIIIVGLMGSQMWWSHY